MLPPSTMRGRAGASLVMAMAPVIFQAESVKRRADQVAERSDS
jgi:hypothetical protein